jgi:FkbM family methyltransferase
MISRNYFTLPFYLPRICRLWKNWPEYLINYVFRNDAPAEYRLRDGATLIDGRGDLPGTLAVIFVRREYGNLGAFRTIVDIGANMGSFAVYAALCCPTAKIYCFEPEQMNFGVLQQNIGINGLEERVSAFKCAVGSYAGRRQLSVRGSLENSFHMASTGASLQMVDCLTIKDIFADQPFDAIDLLKLNCEGAEYEILEGCSRAEFDRISNIRLEYHNLDSSARNGASLSRYLQDQGYSIERFTRYLNTSGFIWATRAAQIPKVLAILAPELLSAI